MGDCTTHRTHNLSGTAEKQITISTLGFQHLHCKNRMNKKEIELHLPCSICGTDILGFDHSMKSTKESSNHSDTKVVVGMRRGGSRHGTGWAAPPVVASSARSRCSSHDGTLGWCRPLGGVGARCSHGAIRVQSAAHSE